MKISKEEVLTVANLARLDLDDSLKEKIAEQIGNILDYVDTLESIDTKDIPPTTHAISLSNAFREDELTESPGTEKALANAPEQEDGCFVVPKVVG